MRLQPQLSELSTKEGAELRLMPGVSDKNCSFLHFRLSALQVDYCRSPRVTRGRRYLDEPHSIVKIIDGSELKA